MAFPRLTQQQRIEKRRNIDREQQKRARQRLRNFIISVKLLYGCARCPEMHPACLHFHHKDPSTKLFAIQRGITQKVRFFILLEEIAKCILLCANCHAKEHYDSRTE